MSPRWTPAAFALVLSAASAPIVGGLGGCSSKTEGTKPTDAGSSGNFDLDGFSGIDAGEIDLLILPNESFTGFDGQHTFKVPVSVYRADSDLKVVLSDPSVADIRPATYADPQADNGKYYVLTAKKAGQVTITATSRGKTVTSKLTVQAYPAARFTAGERRYQNASGADPSCASCHQKAGGADHSPTALSSAGDPDIASVVTSGVKVGGIPITTVQHTWTVTPTELDGLVTYLRALPPRGYTEQ
jgi:mono/diheme cytochrome c family protein